MKTDLVDTLVLMMVKGTTAAKAEQHAITKGGCTPEQAADLVTEARRQITVSASYNRDEQLALAITRLNELYSKGVVATRPCKTCQTPMLVGDLRTAIQAQKELNRLLGLYLPAEERRPTEIDAEDLERQLDLVASYILPLRLCSDAYPVTEHVRVAAELIRTSGRAGVHPQQAASQGP
jgi:hypothetical protein